MIAYDGRRWRIQWPRSGALALILMNVIAYFAELVLLRAGSDLPNQLMLRPADVVQSGKVWQILTSLFLHDPNTVRDLLYNMIWLWMVAPALEQLWGRSRLLWTYFLCGIIGAVFTVVVGGIAAFSAAHGFDPLGLSMIWEMPQVGAAGAVLGLVVAWCMVQRNSNLNMLFLGPIRGMTFFWIVLVIEILSALSYGNQSAATHFGGMLGGLVIGLEIWRPANLRAMGRRAQLKWQRGQIERKLSRFEVIDGGRTERKKRGSDPGDWVN